jgi:hypothetical protein
VHRPSNLTISFIFIAIIPAVVHSDTMIAFLPAQLTTNCSLMGFFDLVIVFLCLLPICSDISDEQE